MGQRTDGIRLRLSTKRILTFRQEVILVSARPFERRFYLALVVLKVVECGSRDIKHRRALQRIRHANAFDKHGSQINVGDTIPIWLEWVFCGLLNCVSGGGFASTRQ